MVEFEAVAQAAIEAKQRGEPVALASIVDVRGSSPRHNGARMLVWPDGRIVGTIGGGTLEYRVIEDAQAALAEGRSRYHNYRFDPRGGPETVGLCGGSVDVHLDVTLGGFVAVAEAALAALRQGKMVAVTGIVREGEIVPTHDQTHLLVWPDGRTTGTLRDEVVERRVIEGAQRALADQTPRTSRYLFDHGSAAPATIDVHLDVLHPRPTLLIVGAGHVAQPLAAIGGLMGMRVCVVDDRAEWANRARFPSAAEVVVVDYQPEDEILAPIPVPVTPSTAVVVATWGYDLPALEQVLRANPGYIGLVASPTKTRVLFKRLQVAGFADEDIRRIHAPTGLDIGAESPAEIAVCILAEILAVMRGKSARPLREVRGGQVERVFGRRSTVSG